MCLLWLESKSIVDHVCFASVAGTSPATDSLASDSFASDKLPSDNLAASASAEKQAEYQRSEIAGKDAFVQFVSRILANRD